MRKQPEAGGSAYDIVPASRWGECHDRHPPVRSGFVRFTLFPTTCRRRR